MSRYVVVYYQQRNIRKNIGIYYPVSKEYYFGSEHYLEVGNIQVTSVTKLAEYRLTDDNRFDFARIFLFRPLDRRITWNWEDPEWCFYVTCLGTNRYKFGKRKFKQYEEFGKSGVISSHYVSASTFR